MQALELKSDSPEHIADIIRNTRLERDQLKARVTQLEEQQRWIPVSEFDIKEDGIYIYIDTRDQLQLSYFYAKDRRKFAHYVKQIYTMQIILPEWEEKQEGE